MYDRFSKIKIISNLVIVQSKTNVNEIAKRATFVKTSGQILRKMSGLFLDEENLGVLKNAKSFVCRVINLSSNQFNVPELVQDMKISEINYILASSYNISMDQIRLIYDGKQLEAEKTVDELGLYDKEKTFIISITLTQFL